MEIFNDHQALKYEYKHFMTQSANERVTHLNYVCGWELSQAKHNVAWKMSMYHFFFGAKKLKDFLILWHLIFEPYSYTHQNTIDIAK